MTTIAYKDGVIAYDSLAVAGITVVDENFNKHIEVNGVHFFFSGSTGNIQKFTAWYLDQSLSADDSMGFCGVIIVEDGVVCSGGYNKEDGFYLNPERPDNHFAIGSGADHALTAMDMGCSAKEAVKMAAKRDTCTGGKIRTFKIKNT